MMSICLITILTHRFQNPPIFILIILLTCISVSFTSSMTHGYATATDPSSSSNMDNIEEAILQIDEVVPFNNTTPASVTVDTLRNLIYVAVNPGYPYNYTSSLCEENTSNQPDITDSVSACSAIYVLDGNSGQINDIIHLDHGEQVKNIDIDTEKGILYATGEYNYLDTRDPDSDEEEVIQFEDDVVYIIDYNNNNNNTSPPKSSTVTKITLYGETEEGKEGDMSDIALDTITDTIYAGILYYEGGREGLFIITNSSGMNNTDSLHNNGIVDDADSTDERIKFIQMGSTGPEQIIINSDDDHDGTANAVYASLEYDDFIAIIDGSSGTTKEQIILQEPRSMSLNPTNNLLYVASGDSNWLNVINMSTNKVVAANTQISYPIASVANNVTGKVYVANCLSCDDFDFTNGTSIYELNSDGSTINWKTYENIEFEENELAINPFTDKLYAIGTDVQSGTSNLYIIDISSL